MRFVIHSLSAAVIVVTMGACGSRAFKSASNASSFGLSSTCSAKPKVFAQSKIQFSTEAPPLSPPQSLVQNGFSKVSQDLEYRNLSVVLSHSCNHQKETRDINFVQKYFSYSPQKIGFSDQNSYSLRVRTTEIDRLVRDANADKCVIGVSENIQMLPTYVPNDAMLSSEKHIQAIRAPEAWDIFYSANSGVKKEVIIAVIDTGIDLLHEDLRDQLWKNTKEIPNNNVDDDSNGLIDDYYGYNFADNISSPAHNGTWTGWYHGTHVSGLAAARMNNSVGVSGVMGRNSKIMSLNVFGSSGVAQSDAIDKAIRYAADQGAQIINMSLGGMGRADSTAAAIEYAISKGSTIFAAAGNNNVDISQIFFSPASYAKDMQGLIAVGSIDSVTFAKSSFSNYSNSFVEIAAPGSNGILSTMPGDSYNLLQGTSMASPVVAGAAGLIYGLIWSRTDKKPKPSEIESMLMISADSLPSLQNYFSQGRSLNLLQAGRQVNLQYPYSGPGGEDSSGSDGDGGTPKDDCL